MKLWRVRCKGSVRVEVIYDIGAETAIEAETIALKPGTRGKDLVRVVQKGEDPILFENEAAISVKEVTRFNYNDERESDGDAVRSAARGG